MVRRFALLRTPDRELAEAWLQKRGPDEVLAWPGLWLAAWGGLERTEDGRAAGTLAGALSDDLDVARTLKIRGLTIDPADHRRLAVTTVAWEGPEALGRLRWQGSLAVAHLAQRTVLIARDVMGVGGLTIGRLGQDGEVVASEAGLVDEPRRSVPGALWSLWTASGITWHQARLHSEARPWLREVPTELRHADAAHIEEGLIARIQAVAQSLERGLGGLTRERPTEPCGRWLVERLGHVDAGELGLWSLAGVESLFGRLAGPPEGWNQGPALVKWPRTEPPEPIEGVPEPDRTQRIYRDHWLPDRILGQARELAAHQGRVLVAPQFDVAALAWLGAIPPDRRPQPLPDGPVA
jgi:hypothetical protein